MYITCQQCSTIFRLDESLLKPTGSKVRCCQCKNVFVEYPPSVEADESALTGAAAFQNGSEQPSKAAVDQELEGIDLDELDAILEQSDLTESDPEDDLALQTPEPGDDALADFNEADLEMDFSLDVEPEIEPPVGASDATSEEEIDNLDLDLDMDMDFDLEAAGDGDDAAAVVPETAPEDSGALSEELELDLEDVGDTDFTLETDAAEEPEAVGSTAPASEEPDLTDLDLDFDDAPIEAEPAVKDQELSLEEDDGLSLDMDEGDELPAEAAEQADDFDLKELDDMLGATDDTGKVSAGKEREMIDEDAELSLDEAPAEKLEAADEPALDVELPEDEDDLDLSELDAMLDVDEGQPALDQGELELEPASDDDMELELEDLDFELDAEFEDKPVAQTSEVKNDAASVQDPVDTAAAQDEELDLADIEQMLEDDDEVLDTQQLEADFLGLDGEGGEKWAKGDAPELDIDDTDEIDLGEIEAAIDMADKDAATGGIEMEELTDEELSLDESSAPDDGLEIELEEDLELELENGDSEPDAEAVQMPELEDDDEFDLSDLDMDMDQDQDTQESAEVIDAGDIELEFQIEEDEPGAPYEMDQAADTTALEAEEEFTVEKTVPASSLETGSGGAAKPVKAKKSTSKGLLFFFILVLLGGAGYVYYAVTYQGLEIPYVSQYLNPQAKDPSGILKLTTTDINSKFVETENSGRLFVIEGKVRNGYSASRKMIRLQGKLFTKGKVLAKSEFAYAGVDVSDTELAHLSVTDIKKRLNSGIAQGGSTNVTPGSTAKFIIVFSELPDDLDEFAIEVISSMPAK